MSDRSKLSSYQLDHFTIHPATNTIQTGEHTKRLEPRAMQLLDYLTQHQGEVCSKAQISEALWPRQMVSDEVITRLIFVLRNALGDDAKSPKFISTIPKKGYVFLLAPKKLEPYKKKSNTLLWTSLCLFILVLIGVVFALVSSPVVYQIEGSKPVTYKEGREYDLAMGEQFNGYFHQHGSETSLYIYSQGSAHRVLVKDRWQKRSLLIAGNQFYYIRFDSEHYQIVKQNTHGQLQVLYNSEKPIFSLSLAGKNQSLLFNLHYNNASTKLYQYNFIDEQVSPVQWPILANINHVFSVYSHQESERLFFTDVVARKPVIYGVDWQTGMQKHKILDFDHVHSISRGKSAEDLLITGRYQHKQGIWSLSLLTNEIKAVYSRSDSEINQAHFDPNTGKLFYSFLDSRVDVKQLDMTGRELPLPDLNSTLVEKNARYSNDGKAIYFASDRSGHFELYHYNIETSVVKTLTALRAKQIWHYAISSHQDKVALVYQTEQIHLAVLAINSGELLQSVVLDEIKFPLSWSKDGKHLYISEHRSRINLYLYDAQTLSIKEKRSDLGLTAAEVSDLEVVAFDYQFNRFVRYNFGTDHKQFLSEPVADPMQLAPNNSHSNGQVVMRLHSDDMQKSVFRFQLAEQAEQRQQVLVANLLRSGVVQDFSPEMSSMLFTEKNQSNSGNIVALTLK